MEALGDAWRLFWYALRGGQEDALAELRQFHAHQAERDDRYWAVGIRRHEQAGYERLGLEAAMIGLTANEARDLFTKWARGEVRTRG